MNTVRNKVATHPAAVDFIADRTRPGLPFDAFWVPTVWITAIVTSIRTAEWSPTAVIGRLRDKRGITGVDIFVMQGRNCRKEFVPMEAMDERLLHRRLEEIECEITRTSP